MVPITHKTRLISREGLEITMINIVEASAIQTIKSRVNNAGDSSLVTSAKPKLSEKQVFVARGLKALCDQVTIILKGTKCVHKAGETEISNSRTTETVSVLYSVKAKDVSTHAALVERVGAAFKVKGLKPAGSAKPNVYKKVDNFDGSDFVSTITVKMSTVDELALWITAGVTYAEGE